MQRGDYLIRQIKEAGVARHLRWLSRLPIAYPLPRIFRTSGVYPLSHSPASFTALELC